MYFQKGLASERLVLKKPGSAYGDDQGYQPVSP